MSGTAAPRWCQTVAARKTRFSCPFHAWTYASRGDLIAVNREQRFGAIDKGSFSLLELPAVERHGMLWVKPTPGGEIDVDERLGRP